MRVNGNPFPFPHMSDAFFPPSGSISHPEDFGPVVVPASGSRLFLSESTIEQWRGLIESEGHVVRRTPDGSILIDDRPTREYQVASNYYFMLGDNLLKSFDSRTMGFVPEDAITGKVFLIYWSSGVRSNHSGLSTRLASVRWNRVGTVPR